MRSITVLVLVLVTAPALATGCVAPPSAQPGPAGVLTPPLRFLEPREIATYENMEVESFIASSPEGDTLLTCLHGEFTRPSYMFASEDGGETFRELTASPSPGVGGDCFVAMSAKGAWSFVHSTGFGTTVATTTDRGATWTVNPAAAQPTNGFADRPWLTYAGETLLLAYMPLIWQPGGIGFTRSEDFGATWSVSQTIVPLDPDYPYVRHGNFLHGPDGAIRIPHVRAQSSNAGENAGTLRLAFAVSRDQGRTWIQERVATITAAAATATAAAQAGDGTLFWPYYRPAGDGYDLRVLVSRDMGGTWKDYLVAEGLDSPRAWWGDGRPDGSADVTFLASAALVEKDGPHVAAARLSPQGDRIAADVAPIRAYEDALEYVGIDHDGAGRAFVVIPKPGFRVTTQGHLYFAAEVDPRAS